ncbi:MAG: Crp/Fnr family transcriptional regulator [Crocinitomicaceae bacterium]|nr:Crp/Fnr family transcriptional regulator [Crocinitomicaceae bacterium]
MNLKTWISKLDQAQIWEEEIELARNEYLKVSGSVDRNMYFVVEGCLRVFVIEEFEEHTIRFGYQDNIIGALDSFITGKPSEFYIQALKKTVVKRVSREKYMDFIHSNNENVEMWNLMLEFLVLAMMERERDLLVSSPVERYKRVQERSPQLFQEVPNKYIASYLRMTPETLSRLKKS